MKPQSMAGEGNTQGGGGGQGERRPMESLPVVVPNRWQGEVDCAVGPFSSQAVASYFANRMVDFGQYEVFSLRVFAHRNGWYVEVRHRERNS